MSDCLKHGETRSEPEESSDGSIDSQSRKTELFPRFELPTEPQIMETMKPFSSSAVAPALRKLRHLLQCDAVDEQEVLAIFRGAKPRDSYPPASLEQVPERSLSLLVYRWTITKELIEAGRQDGRFF